MSNHARRQPLAAYWRYSDMFAVPFMGGKRVFLPKVRTWGKKR